MSGELEIDHGGAIAVDTERMRAVGARVGALAIPFEEARAAIRRALDVIVCTLSLVDEVGTDALQMSAAKIDGMRRDAEDAGVKTLLMADVFEVVELRAEAAALALTDGAAAAASVLARVDRMLAADERLEPMVDWIVAGWRNERFEGLDEQWDVGGVMDWVFRSSAFIGVTAGLGKIRPGTTLKGAADPVTVTAVKSATPATAPTNLENAFQRMPSASGAQIAVEKITRADGTTQYIAYLKGTQNFNPAQSGGEEPWDLKSNGELYTGKTSASYQATLDALAAAGAQPGDQVDIVAHSQAGMIGARLAMESEYDVQMLITAGSPVQPTLRDDQTLIQLAHTDDFVVGFSGGGSLEGTGSADSFIATRVGDPDPELHDLALKTHGLDTYGETARMIDASDDPRAVALDEYWAELGDAVSVERTEYYGERTEPAE